MHGYHQIQKFYRKKHTSKQEYMRKLPSFPEKNGEEVRDRRRLADAWSADIHAPARGDIQMMLIVLWQPLPHVHDELIEWFFNVFAPGMVNPDLLRLRIFKLQQTSAVEDGELKEKDIKDMHQYMSIWDFAVEELPWEIMVYLGSSPEWMHYVEGGLLQWQIGQYLVNREYPDEEADERGTSSDKD
jgi:hypothetical protein